MPPVSTPLEAWAAKAGLERDGDGTWTKREGEGIGVLLDFEDEPGEGLFVSLTVLSCVGTTQRGGAN